ncbi:MAG: protein translocase SEC61 complex subunit gamma [Nitrososphaerota archaeon]
MVDCSGFGGMGLRGFLRSAATTIKLARKPTREEFTQAMKIVAIGVAAIGLITFVIKFLALAIQGA